MTARLTTDAWQEGRSGGGEDGSRGSGVLSHCRRGLLSVHGSHLIKRFMLIKQKVFLSYRNCCSPGGRGREQGREGREYPNRSRGDDSVAMNESENSYTHRHKYIHTYSHNMLMLMRPEEGKKRGEMRGECRASNLEFLFRLDYERLLNIFNI